MSVIDHHDLPLNSSAEERRCALMFCATWLGFFVLIGLLSYAVSLF